MNEEQPPPLETSFESGGEICRAWHFPPLNDALSKYGRAPCVVMGHGFGGTRDAGLAPYARRFAAEGLHAVIFDYRNFGASDGEPRQLVSIKKQLEDWAAATAFAREMPGVDPARVAIWGSSLSGGHVIETAYFDRRVAAVIAQCPALSGATALRAYLRYAGFFSGLRLLLAGLYDQLRGLLRLSPKMIPIAGKPGSLAFLTSGDAEAGYRAIAPADWRNETPARIVLRLPFYRLQKYVYKLTCPQLQQHCLRDVIAPPPRLDVSLQPHGRRNMIIKTYDCGHFDLYRGDWFGEAAADQIAFLKAVFS